MLRVIIFLSLFLIQQQVKSAYSRAVTSTAGDITTTGNWSYNPTSPANPTSKDTLFIGHAMTWGSNVDWSTSAIDVIVIRSGGSIGPTGNNNVLSLPLTAIIIIETGGAILNPSGNASNHGISLGLAGATSSVGIWGKRTCASNGPVYGPVLMNSSNPCGFIILPVEILNLSAQTIANGVELRWQVESEENISYYAIYKSNGNDQFMRIATLSATGMQAYRYVYSGEKGTLYKIRAIKPDGSVVDEKLVYTRSSSQGVLYQAQGFLYISASDDSNPLTYQIFALQGKTIADGDIHTATGIDISALNTGQPYILRTQSADGQAKTVKFIREN